jgi:site-specific DNA-methyltransferase (adenine-specific)
LILQGRKADIHQRDRSVVYRMDNKEAMSLIPDGYFDLAVVDPEFGISIGKSRRLVIDKGHKAKEWDDKPIDMNYFKELFRISKNQIIWGGNYYMLPGNKHCIIWDKIQPKGLSFGMFDYAWTSFKGANKIFRKSVQNEKDGLRIHPTQKPISLYDWIYANYLPDGGKVIDTHLGSQTNRIAANKADNIDFVGIELDHDYFRDGNTKYENHLKIPVIKFPKAEILEQKTLF